jgi:hypothetical protein
MVATWLTVISWIAIAGALPDTGGIAMPQQDSWAPLLAGHGLLVC